LFLKALSNRRYTFKLTDLSHEDYVYFIAYVTVPTIV
jgi:hypothetical protein